MEASKKPDTKKKLRSAAIKAAGTVTAAGMLFNAAVEPEDLLTNPEHRADTANSAHVQSGSAPVYTVKGSKPAPAPAPTKAELFRERVVALPAPVKGLVLLPLWTLGAIANYALSLLLGLFMKVFGGSILTFLFQFALIFGLFALALKLLFPDKKLKDLLTKKNLLWMAVAALVLTAADPQDLVRALCQDPEPDPPHPGPGPAVSFGLAHPLQAQEAPGSGPRACVRDRISHASVHPAEDRRAHPAPFTRRHGGAHAL